MISSLPKLYVVVVVVFGVVVVALLVICEEKLKQRHQHLRQVIPSNYYQNHRSLFGFGGEGLTGFGVKQLINSDNGSFKEVSEGSAQIVQQQHINSNDNKLAELQDLIRQLEEEKAVYKSKETSGNKLTALVHVGPMKTGSTAIQHTLHQSEEALVLDNYEYANLFYTGHPNSFFMCFDDEGMVNNPDEPCNVPLLHEISQKVSFDRKRNVIFSAEGFWRTELNLGLMKKYLIASGWDNQVIVMYYRRYYDWLLSFYNQGNKSRDVSIRRSIVDKLNHSMKNDIDPWSIQYVVGEYNRYKEHFDNVKLYNMHALPKGDVREAIMCDAMEHGVHSCAKLHELQESDEHSNSHGSLIYDALAYYALEMKLWSERDDMKLEDVTKLVRNHQEKVLQLSEYDFAVGRICPTDEVYDWLLEMSLKAEELLFPDYYNNQGKQEIMDHFNASKRKFCDYDGKAVLLESDEWKKFFQSL